MSTTLSTNNGRTQHPPQPIAQSAAIHPRQRRHVGVVDRLALHLGVALITWSRRPRVHETNAAENRERRANRIEQHLARMAREREAESIYRLMLPQR